MLNGLVFDSDGTIIDIKNYLKTFASLQKVALKELGGRYDLPETIADFYEPLRLPLEESTKFLTQVWQVPASEYWARLHVLDRAERPFALKYGRLKLFDDIKEISRLKEKYSLTIALLSNTPEDIVRLQLDYFQIADLFPVIVCGNYKDGLTKPENKGLRLCLEKMSLPPERAAMIGDAEIDVKVGCSLNTVTIQIKRNHFDYHLVGQPDYNIDSFSELEGIIQKENKSKRKKVSFKKKR